MPPQPLSPLETAIREFDGVVGLAAKNLTTGEEIVVNADTRFPTASTIKTAVMLEAWHQASQGKLSMDERLTLRDADKVGGSGVLNGMSGGLALPIGDLLHLMMVLSDNTATNLLVNRLGTKKINDRLLSYGLESTKIFRPTFRDGRQNKTDRDPPRCLRETPRLARRPAWQKSPSWRAKLTDLKQIASLRASCIPSNIRCWCKTFAEALYN